MCEIEGHKDLGITGDFIIGAGGSGGYGSKSTSGQLTQGDISEEGLSSGFLLHIVVISMTLISSIQLFKRKSN
ncbi:MAG: hypothetical protein OEY49_11970 [Candidatus Heimdallarchaeota archaeon]|nr:hypothetical protein [Candidatus Heimdallarchaeota archaeon]